MGLRGTFAGLDLLFFCWRQNKHHNSKNSAVTRLLHISQNESATESRGFGALISCMGGFPLCGARKSFVLF